MKLLKIAIVLFLIGGIMDRAQATNKWDDTVVRTYQVSDFNRIHLEGGYQIILEQSSTPGLKIRADEEVFRYIDVDSDDETLELNITKEHLDFERIELFISFRDLKELHIEGGAKLETKGYLDLSDFDLHVEGGAKIEMEMKVDNLGVLGEGGVMFNLRGVARQMNAQISGAGHLDAEMLRAESVTFEIQGVGTGTVHATETLRAIIEGVGKIKYKGDPDVDKRIEGIGFVSKV